MKELEKVKPYILSDKIPILAILTLTKPEQHETVTESEPNNIEKKNFCLFCFLKKEFHLSPLSMEYTILSEFSHKGEER